MIEDELSKYGVKIPRLEAATEVSTIGEALRGFRSAMRRGLTEALVSG